MEGYEYLSPSVETTESEVMESIRANLLRELHPLQIGSRACRGRGQLPPARALRRRQMAQEARRREDLQVLHRRPAQYRELRLVRGHGRCDGVHQGPAQASAHHRRAIYALTEGSMKTRFIVTAALAASLFFACAGAPKVIPQDLSARELVQRAQEATDVYNYKAAIAYYEALNDRFGADPLYMTTSEYEIAFIAYKEGHYAAAKDGLRGPSRPVFRPRRVDSPPTLLGPGQKGAGIDSREASCQEVTRKSHDRIEKAAASRGMRRPSRCKEGRFRLGLTTT